MDIQYSRYTISKIPYNHNYDLWINNTHDTKRLCLFLCIVDPIRLNFPLSNLWKSGNIGLLVTVMSRNKWSQPAYVLPRGPNEPHVDYY